MPATSLPIGSRAPAPEALVFPALDALATLYGYPREDAAAGAAAALAVVATDCPDAADDLTPLEEHLRTSDRAACEELYVRTFELNPVCALEVGWQLYGEQYARGTFLVRAQQLCRDAAVDPGTELADHLPNVLRVLARLEGPSAGALAVRFAGPAVRGMCEKLAGAGGNPYRGLLSATARVLERHYGGEVESE